MAVALSRRVSRDRNPLQWRRVKHLRSGRVGYIGLACGTSNNLIEGAKQPPYAFVVWDDAPVDNGWKRPEKVEFGALDILEPEPIAAPVRVRKVLFRGHKEQVAERMRMLPPPPEGTERYIEFDPQPMSYRRWRIVYIGPPLPAEKVADTPDQYRHAASLRAAAKDAADYSSDGDCGF